MLVLRAAHKEKIMFGYIRVLGQHVRRGRRMAKGVGWRLVMQRGRKRAFVGTLLTTFNLGRWRIAVFSVPK
jgi:hypothetical protein